VSRRNPGIPFFFVVEQRGWTPEPTKQFSVWRQAIIAGARRSNGEKNWKLKGGGGGAADPDLKWTYDELVGMAVGTVGDDG